MRFPCATGYCHQKPASPKSNMPQPCQDGAAIGSSRSRPITSKAYSALVCCWIVCSSVVSPAAPLDNWEWQNPVPATDQLSAIAHGNNRWVGVGFNSAVIISTDGTNWQRQIPPTPTPQLTQSIAFGNGIFLMPNWTNCYRTTDGITWSMTPLAEPDARFNLPIERIVFLEGQFFGLGYWGYIIASTNGTHWTVRNEPSNDLFESVRSLVFGNSIYLALSGRTQVMTSPDGKSWEVVNLAFPFPALADITFRDGLFYAVSESGRVFSSANGLDWTELADLGCRADGIFSAGNGLYVVGGNCPGREILFSADGVNWSGRSLGLRTVIKAVGFDESAGFVAVGYTFWDPGSVLSGAVFSSRDGIDWTRRDRGFHVLLEDVTYGGGKFVAISGLFSTNAAAMVSTNGTEWTRANLALSGRLRRAAYGNGTHVIIGRNNQRNPPSPIFTSTDAMDWTLQTSATNIGTFLNAITYAAGRFVAVGFSNTVARSLDGTNWVSESLHGSDDLWSIAYGNGTFVAVGEKSRFDAVYPDNILTSSDGENWTRRTIGPEAKNLRVIAYGNGRFVAVGETNSFSSADGLQWRSHSFPVADVSAEKLAFGNGYFVLASRVRQIGTFFNNVYSSPDGETWTEHAMRAAPTMWAAAFGADRFVMVTDLGGILRSDPIPGRLATGRLLARYVPSNDSIELTFSGESPSGYRIEASDNLKVPGWTDLGSFTENGDFTADASGPLRFYRAAKR
jgi:hypothetical protein